MIDPESGDAQLAEVDAPAVSGAQGSSIFNAVAGARTCSLEMKRKSRVDAAPWLMVRAAATPSPRPPTASPTMPLPQGDRIFTIFERGLIVTKQERTDIEERIAP